MKNLKKKFVAIIILFIVFIIGTEIYKTFIVTGTDRNSYAILIEGKAKLNNTELQNNKKEKLQKDDKIQTIGEKSLVVIKWGDGSITRLGGDSVLVVKESEVEKNLLNIKISFELLKGKTWSDVISFIGEDSYFHQSFADTTAAVRGTVFEVNLNKDYVYVEKHEVKLTKTNGDKKVITEKKPFIISKFSFTDLLNFLKKYKDKSWQDLNNVLDKKFYEELIKNVGDLNKLTTKNLEDFTQYSADKQTKIYNLVLSEYQKINFVDTSDIENYQKKLELKKQLIAISDNENKSNLLITTLYDIKDLAKNKDFSSLTQNLTILGENKEYLKNLDMNISDYIDLNLFKNLQIPEGLKTEFEKSFNNIKDNLDLENLNLDNNEIINDLKDSALKSINGVKDQLNKLK